MTIDKIIKDFEILLEKDFALPHSCIEEKDEYYIFYSDDGEKKLTKDEAISVLVDFRSLKKTLNFYKK